MEKIKIRNWAKWQSYRGDRGQPPWIKLHRSLMRDPDWVALSDAERGQLVSIWLLAADDNGKIPASAVVVKKLCFMESEPNLKLFSSHRFFDGDVDYGARVTPSRRQVDAPEKSREEKSREDSCSPAVSDGGFDAFWKAYPRKVGKIAAQKAWANAKGKPELPNIIAAVERQKGQKQWSKDGGQYIPHPAVWLNQGRWDDEVQGAQDKKEFVI